MNVPACVQRIVSFPQPKTFLERKTPVFFPVLAHRIHLRLVNITIFQMLEIIHKASTVCNTSKRDFFLLILDLEVHIQNAPVEQKRPFQNVLSSTDRDICSPDGLPICTQLPANHLKHSHSTAYKTTHRHRGIRFSTSTSKSQQSLKPPGEGKHHFRKHFKLQLTQ